MNQEDARDIETYLSIVMRQIKQSCEKAGHSGDPPYCSDGQIEDMPDDARAEREAKEKR